MPEFLTPSRNLVHVNEEVDEALIDCRITKRLLALLVQRADGLLTLLKERLEDTRDVAFLLQPRL